MPGGQNGAVPQKKLFFMHLSAGWKKQYFNSSGWEKHYFQPVWLGETYLNYLAGRNWLRLGWEKAQCAQLAWTVGAELAQADALTSVHCVVCVHCDRRKQHNEPIKFDANICESASKSRLVVASADWLRK